MHTDDVSALILEVAARLILPRFRTLDRGEIHLKGPGDLVTVADREAEAALTDALRAAEPGVLVVGEEASFDDPSLESRVGGAERAWVVDPVDGTRNFAHGSPDFGVMLAEVERGWPVRSWIWQPVHQHLYVAERGGGVRLDGRPLPPLTGRARPYRVEVYGARRGPHARVLRHRLPQAARGGGGCARLPQPPPLGPPARHPDGHRAGGLRRRRCHAVRGGRHRARAPGGGLQGTARRRRAA